MTNTFPIFGRYMYAWHTWTLASLVGSVILPFLSLLSLRSLIHALSITSWHAIDNCMCLLLPSFQLDPPSDGLTSSIHAPMCMRTMYHNYVVWSSMTPSPTPYCQGAPTYDQCMSIPLELPRNGPVDSTMGDLQKQGRINWLCSISCAALLTIEQSWECYGGVLLSDHVY